MNIRRLFAIFSLILVGGILVACGTEDEDPAPTEPPAATTAPADSVVEPTATDVADSDDADDVTATPPAAALATPGASPVAPPLAGEATPDLVDAADMATPVATPLAAEATPDDLLYTGSEEDLMSTPQIQPIVTVPAEPIPTIALSGTLTLDGRAQQDYTLGEEGCVGLGEWRQLKPGTQVIVRDGLGAVVDVSVLEAHDTDDACTWAFDIEAPGEGIFSVSIPMVTEVWFEHGNPAVESGELELFVP